MALIGLLEVFLAIACFLIIIFSRSNNGLPWNWPVVGMLPTLLFELHRFHDLVTAVLKNSDCNFMFEGPLFSNMDMLITSDPANINYMMSINFANYPKGPEFKEMFDVLGDGIFNSGFDSWKGQRRVAQVLGSHQQFRKFLVMSTQDKVDKGLVPLIEQIIERGLVVDLQDLFQRFTFDATCVITTGHDPGCLAIDFPEIAFSRALEDAEEAIFFRHVIPKSVWKLQKWLNIGEEKKLREAWKVLDKVAFEIISTKRKEHEEIRNDEEEDEKGVHLLASYMREDDHHDDKFLRDTILSFLLAGRDTTSSALSWFFWLLSENPKAEERIREEIAEMASSNDSETRKVFDIEQIKGLPYLHGALCETLRLYPPVPTEHKAPLKPDTLPSGHQVDPKNKILISLYAMGRTASIWGEDCLEFKPERWISDGGGIRHEPSYKFMAFNAGPRTCLGKEVAFTQMKMVAANIVYNYNVHVLEGQSVTPCLCYFAYEAWDEGELHQEMGLTMLQAWGIFHCYWFRKEM